MNDTDLIKNHFTKTNDILQKMEEATSPATDLPTVDEIINVNCTLNHEGSIFRQYECIHLQRDLEDGTFRNGT
jgi:hypothetical protein